MLLVYIHPFILHRDLITQQSIMEEEFKQTSKQRGCWQIVSSGIPQFSIVIIQHSTDSHTVLRLSTTSTDTLWIVIQNLGQYRVYQYCHIQNKLDWMDANQ